MTELEFIKTVISICSGITVIGAACGVIYNSYLRVKKPQKDMTQRM